MSNSLVCGPHTVLYVNMACMVRIAGSVLMHNAWKENSETSIRPSVFFIIRAYLGHWPMGSNIYDFGIKKSPSYPNFFEIPPGYCIPRRVTHNPGESTFSSKLMHTVSQKWMWILILLIEGYISSFFLA